MNEVGLAGPGFSINDCLEVSMCGSEDQIKICSVRDLFFCAVVDDPPNGSVRREKIVIVGTGQIGCILYRAADVVSCPASLHGCRFLLGVNRGIQHSQPSPTEAFDRHFSVAPPQYSNLDYQLHRKGELCRQNASRSERDLDLG